MAELDCIGGSPTIINCTISDNVATQNGGGIYCRNSSSPEVVNTILWGNTINGTPHEIYLNDANSSVTITYSNIDPSNISGAGTATLSDNTNADPLFVDPANGDYHLKPGSPCIDKGTDDTEKYPDLPNYDIDGDIRPQGDGYDMGADEVTCASDAECDDDNSCTLDVCDQEAGVCIHTTAANDTPCDDNNLCTGSESCSDGVCRPSAWKSCRDDKNPCTTDECDPETGQCIHTPLEDETPCDNVCRIGECLSGVCEGFELDCDDGNLCTYDSCLPNSGCIHIQPACLDDKNPCTTDECDPETGECSNTPLEDKTPCDDVCTTGECLNGECQGIELDCDDGNLCTSDRCIPNSGCVHIQPVCLDDKNPCTTDECDPENGQCIHTPLEDKTPCDDVCTTGECLSGVCEGTELDCDDGNLCTQDTCSPGHGCIYAHRRCFDDYNPCTVDECNPDTGECNDQVADGIACEDACTTEGKCSFGVCRGTELDCDDGDLCTLNTCSLKRGCFVFAMRACFIDNNSCTIDECNPETGECHDPVADGTACDDRNECTTDDSCSNSICLGDVEEGCNAPPDCSNAYPSITRILSGEEIWSPNHKMVPVRIMGVNDPDLNFITTTITGITQDEPVNGIGDGNTYPDGDGVGTNTAWVRAERAGPANSRV